MTRNNDITIEKIYDGNERTREGRNGRIYVSTAGRTVWIVRVGGAFLADFDTRREAKAAAARLAPKPAGRVSAIARRDRAVVAAAEAARKAEAGAAPEPRLLFGRDPSLLIPGAFRDLAMAEAEAEYIRTKAVAEASVETARKAKAATKARAKAKAAQAPAKAAGAKPTAGVRDLGRRLSRMFGG